MHSTLLCTVLIGFTTLGLCVSSLGAESQTAPRFESSSVGNIFLDETGQVDLVVPEELKLRSGTLRVTGVNEDLIYEDELGPGDTRVTIPLNGRGYYHLSANLQCEDGASYEAATSAAVIGPEIPMEVRKRSPFGIQYDTEGLATAAGAGWVRTYIYPEKDKYRHGLESGERAVTPERPPVRTRIIWCAIFQPLWLQDRGGAAPSRHSLYPVTDRQKHRDLMEYVVKVSPEEVQFLEVYNESSGRWHGTPAQYVECVKDVRQAVHKANPSAKVLAPVICSIDRRRYAFLTPLVEKGLLDNIDGFSVHTYVDGTAPEGEFIDRLHGLKEYLAQHGHRDMPLYITEYGWTLPPGDWQKAVDPLTQARYCSRSMILMLAERNVECLIWFKLPAVTLNPASGYALLAPGLYPRPSYAAWANTARCLAGVDRNGTIGRLRPIDNGLDSDAQWANTAGDDIIPYIARFKKGENTVMVLWTTRGTVKYHFPALRKAVWARDMVGRDLPRTEDGTVEVSRSPVFMELRP